MEKMGIVRSDTGMDGLFGALLVVSSINDLKILFDGPDGCRRYMMMMSSVSNPDLDVMGGARAMVGENKFTKIFGTSMNADDFIYNSSYKLRSEIDHIKSLTENPIVIMPSPGSSLIGIDYKAIIENYENVFVIDNSYISKSYSESVDDVTIDVIKWFLPKEGSIKKNTVNIIGIDPCARCKDYFVNEMTSILDSMGLEVICKLGTNTSIKEIVDSVNASANILISSEYGMKTAKYYEENYKIPYVECSEGSPVGFDAMEIFIREISKSLNVNSKIAIDRLITMKKHSYRCLLKDRGMGNVKEHKYAISGDSSIVLPLIRWIYSSFSMKPYSVDLNYEVGQRYTQQVKKFLESIGRGDVMGKKVPGDMDLIISDKVFFKIVYASKECRAFIGLNSLSSYTIDLMDRPIMGLQGSKYIIDTIINDMK